MSTSGAPTKRQRLSAASMGAAMLGLVAAVLMDDRFNAAGAILIILVAAAGGKALASAFVSARPGRAAATEGLIMASVAAFMVGGALTVVVGADALETDGVFLSIAATVAGVVLYAQGGRRFLRHDPPEAQ